MGEGEREGDEGKEGEMWMDSYASTRRHRVGFQSRFLAFVYKILNFTYFLNYMTCYIRINPSGVKGGFLPVQN